MDDPFRMIAAFVADAADRLLDLLAGSRQRPSQSLPRRGQPVVFAIMRMECGGRADPRSGRQAEPLTAQLSRCARCRAAGNHRGGDR
jgi:hypothetical protein